MGSSHFFRPQNPRIGPTNLNMMARANAAPGYAGRTAAIGAQKDLGAAQALVAAHKLEPSKKTVPADVPGPKV